MDNLFLNFLKRLYNMSKELKCGSSFKMGHFKNLTKNNLKKIIINNITWGFLGEMIRLTFYYPMVFKLNAQKSSFF